MASIKEGEILFGDGKIEEAKNCFLSILKDDPENKEAYNNLGVICFRNKELEQAAEYFEKTLTLDPFFKSAILNFAAVLKQLDSLHIALPLLETNIKRNPSDKELQQLFKYALEGSKYTMKKKMEMLHEQGSIEEALKVSGELNQLSPNNAENLNDYAVLCYESGQVEKARRAIDKARQLSPEDVDIKEHQEIIHRGLNVGQNLEEKNLPEGQNVAVMEFLYHWNYFITTVEVLKRRHNVFLIIGSSFKNTLVTNYRLDLDGFTHIVLENLNWSAINKFIHENNISKIFVPTIQGFELIYQFSKYNLPAPFYFTIHNFDLWLGRRPFVNMEDKLLDQQINRVYHHCCREVIEKSAGIISIDTSLRDNVSKIIDGKKVHVMPWNVNHDLISFNDYPDRKETVIFTIPASIDRGRRNYGVALETFRHLARDYNNIKLVLLGRPIDEYGKQIIEKSKCINEENGREVIEFFEGYIHQDIYEDRLRHSDYFILPISNLQVFGRYKASAAMYDAMFSGRPILIPENMYFSKDFCMKFGDGFIVYKDLKDTMEDILTPRNGGQEKIKRAAVENANYFFIDNQVALANEQFFDLCS